MNENTKSFELQQKQDALLKMNISFSLSLLFIHPVFVFLVLISFDAIWLFSLTVLKQFFLSPYLSYLISLVCFKWALILYSVRSLEKLFFILGWDSNSGWFQCKEPLKWCLAFCTSRLFVHLFHFFLALEVSLSFYLLHDSLTVWPDWVIFERFGVIVSINRSPNAWLIFGLTWKARLFIINYCGYFWATFGKN